MLSFFLQLNIQQCAPLSPLKKQGGHPLSSPSTQSHLYLSFKLPPSQPNPTQPDLLKTHTLKLLSLSSSGSDQLSSSLSSSLPFVFVCFPPLGFSALSDTFVGPLCFFCFAPLPADALRPPPPFAAPFPFPPPLAVPAVAVDFLAGFFLLTAFFFFLPASASLSPPPVFFWGLGRGCKMNGAVCCGGQHTKPPTKHHPLSSHRR